MNKPTELPHHDFNDENSNTSPNPSFEDVLRARMNRRSLLRGSVGTAATALLGGLGLSACGGGDDLVVSPPAPPAAPAETLLAFAAVAKSLEDKVSVPVGYTASVLLAVGDPLAAGVGAAKNDGTDTGYDRRVGDDHDGMEYFGLSTSGAPDAANNDRALLGINHEYINQLFLHRNGPTPNPRPASEADIEVDCHGVAIVEIAKTAGKFAYVQSSPFNRRITAASEIEMSGPVRGHPLLVTRFSPTGTRTRGTVNNCGTGKTPWGTLLTGEETGLATTSALPVTMPAARPRPTWHCRVMAGASRRPPPLPRATVGRPPVPTTSTSAGTPASPAPRRTAATTTATRSTARAT